MTTLATKSSIRVLLVDDDQDDFVLTRDLLAAIPGRFQLDWQQDFEDGLKAVCSDAYDIVLLDYRLGAKTGLDLLAEARKNKCDAPIIILTGLSDSEIDMAAMRSGAADYLEKHHLDATLLERSIRYAIQNKLVEAELERRVRERTEELNRANAALREADRRKDRFLATLAHELRNPLAPIRNALEILRLTEENPEAGRTARALIERQVAHLVKLIDDLLDVARISSDKVRLHHERVDLAEVVESALEQSRPALDKAGQTLAVELPRKPVRLFADRLRVAQILTNILHNAAKYSEPGGVVELTARRSGDNVEIRVRDRGLGIPPNMLPHIFEPFTQVDRTLNRAQGGLGIGLSLVRRLVEAHGGQVAATSDGPGRGSEFVVTLPCHPPDQADAESSSKS